MVQGKIIKGVGGLYTVKTKQGIYMCKPRGIFRKDNIKPLIGDEVSISIIEEQKKEASISIIHNRKNEMKRPKVSNVDLVIFVVTIKNPKISPDIIDRFILLAEEQKLEILLCINKIDIVNDDEIFDLKNIYENIGYNILFLSALKNDCFDKIIKYIKGKVCVIAGPSGVGKSSIVNLLLKNKVMEISNISEKTKRGKHTTRHAEILEIDENTFIVDTPGFTSITIDHIEKDNLQNLFIEFRPFLNSCRFNNCFHYLEPDCRIKQEVSKKVISEERYNSYISCFLEIEKGRK